LDARVNDPNEASIGDLLHTLVEDGRALVGAEVALYKEIALYRAGRARTGLIALVAGGLLAFAGLVAALVGCVLGLAPLIGPFAAGLLVLAVAGALGFLLVRYGAGKLAALSGSPEETAALAAGERDA
jgi:hypothetical protein